MLFGGLLAAGVYLVWKNSAHAGVAPLGSAASVPYGGGSGTSYTVPALNAAVPGVSFAPSTQDPSLLTSTLTAIPAATAAQLASADTFWNGLQPVNPPASGYITLPSGTQFAAALMSGGNTRIDANGNLYVQWAGQVYQLAQMSDSSGNWPARLIVGS
jgi:hypothetical protein